MVQYITKSFKLFLTCQNLYPRAPVVCLVIFYHCPYSKDDIYMQWQIPVGMKDLEPPTCVLSEALLWTVWKYLPSWRSDGWSQRRGNWIIVSVNHLHYTHHLGPPLQFYKKAFDKTVQRNLFRVFYMLTINLLFYKWFWQHSYWTTTALCTWESEVQNWNPDVPDFKFW